MNSLTSLLLKKKMLAALMRHWEAPSFEIHSYIFLSRQKDLDHKYLKIKSWLQFIWGKDLSRCPEKEEKRHAPRSSCAPSWVECPAPNPPPTQVCSWKTHSLDLVKIWYADGTHFWILIIEGIIENWLDKWTLCLHATRLALMKNPHVKEKCERRLVQHEPSTDTLLGYDKLLLLLLLLWSPPHSPHSLMWDQLHIQLDNNCNFQSQEIGIRRGSSSDSWLHLSFCLLIDAFFILSTLAEKILVSPEGTTLSNRISPGSRAGCFEKRNAHSGRHFALFDFSLWFPTDNPPDIRGNFLLKKMDFCQCFILRNTLRAACSQKKHCLCLKRELI